MPLSDLELAGAFEQAKLLFSLTAVIRGIDIAVQIGGKEDRQFSFLHSLTPSQLDADPCRDPLDDEYQHDQTQQNRADLVPAVGAHGEDQRRADAARADKTEDGRIAQVHIKAVDDRGGEVCGQLRQDAIADLLEGRAARGVQ